MDVSKYFIKNKVSKKYSGMEEHMKTIIKFLKTKKFGFILATIQGIITLLLLGSLVLLNIVPTKYFIPAVIILILFTAYVVFTQYSKRFRTFGKILSVVLSVVFFIVMTMVFKANDTLGKITGAEKKTDVISVYVMSTDIASSIKDVANDNFGILSTLDRDNTNKVIEKINKTLSSTIKTEEYTDPESLVENLYSSKIRAIILNEAYVSTIEEIQDENGNYPYANFQADTKKIETKNIVTIIDRSHDTNVVKEPFMLYLSGIDVAGSISTTSRSDVNIIAVVNPVSKQILLLSTPRDYYIPTAVSNGVPDKLTHAGLSGVDCSMKTLDMLYDIDINFYFRVNFTGFTKVIDALGGITVHSDYDFVTTHGGDHITVGDNFLTGEQALGFARERYAFADGDRQRGRNQMEVISKVLNKAASSALLNNYTSLMDGLVGSFETSMSPEDLASLARMQLDDMASWNVQQYSVSGSGDRQPTYSMPRTSLWVMQPDQTYINNAKALINQVVSGETINMDILDGTTPY